VNDQFRNAIHTQRSPILDIESSKYESFKFEISRPPIEIRERISKHESTKFSHYLSLDDIMDVNFRNYDWQFGFYYCSLI
jgi:hypothetical protein